MRSSHPQQRSPNAHYQLSFLVQVTILSYILFQTSNSFDNEIFYHDWISSRWGIGIGSCYSLFRSPVSIKTDKVSPGVHTLIVDID